MSLKILNEPTMQGTYQVQEDVTETLPDGRVILVARKGTVIPMAVAIKHGLVKIEAPVGPSESKITGPKKIKTEPPASEPEPAPDVAGPKPAPKGGKK
jgi:hypothetical protein